MRVAFVCGKMCLGFKSMLCHLERDPGRVWHSVLTRPLFVSLCALSDLADDSCGW